MKTTTTLKNLYGSLSNNTSSTNLALGQQLISDAHRYLIQKYFANERTITTSTVASQQFYTVAANLSKITDATITVGQLKFTPVEVKTRQEWDRINALPYTGDIPRYFFIYNNQIGFFPIPSSSGNTITLNFKTRVPDLSFSDFTTGTISGTSGSTAITGSSTTWNSVGLYPLADVTYYNLYISATPPKGDGLWYPISSFTSDTALTLANPLVNPATMTGASYTIGQMPLLEEDFHDMLVHSALMTYFSSVVSDQVKFGQFERLYNERLQLLKEYAGTKTVQIDLEQEPINQNVNLYPYSP